MKVVFLGSSRSDVLTLYYGSVFPAGSPKARVRLERVLRLLQDNPHLGHPLEDGLLREYSMPNLPFSLIYLVADARIEILRLWDQRGDRERLQEWVEESSRP